MRTPRFLPRELIAPRQIVILTVFSVLKTLGLVLGLALASLLLAGARERLIAKQSFGPARV